MAKNLILLIVNKPIKFSSICLAIVSGVFVGFVNGFLGAGGGMLVVPILRLVFKLEPKQAHATAVLTILPITVVSSIVYIIKKAVCFSAVWPVAIGTFLGGVIGSMVLTKLKNNTTIVLFSLVMIVAGFLMIFR